MQGSKIASRGLRTWQLGSLALMLGISVIVAGYFRHRGRQGSRPASDSVPLLVPAAITLGRGIHLLGGLDPSAAYVVETLRQGSSWLIPAFKATRGRSNRRWHGSGSTGGACAPSCSRTFTETIAEGLNTCAQRRGREYLPAWVMQRS